MKKLFFENIDDEQCHPEEYFRFQMELEGIDELPLHKATKTKVSGYFWCRRYEIVGEKGQGTCGRDCPNYNPRNGKSGICKHYSLEFYEPTEEIITLKTPSA